jgi:hypothetical protein
LKRKCDRSDNKTPPSGRGSKQEQISAKFRKADHTVVRPDVLLSGFSHIEFSTSLTKIIVSFKVRIDILLTLSAHTHLLCVRSHFNFFKAQQSMQLISSLSLTNLSLSLSLSQVFLAINALC